MVKRLFDIAFSLLVFLLASPLFLIAIIGIKISSKGSIFYTAQRAGLNGESFTIYKFRSMHECDIGGDPITALNDVRVFKLGSLLRKLKLDELPQFYNVLIGDMSVVGPRPEDINIVREYYTTKQMETLIVLPGIASPGSLFNYTHVHKYITENNETKDYLSKLLPIKLAIENIYVENKSFSYDMSIIIRTMTIIMQILLGKEDFPFPKEYHLAIEKGLFSP